jgi:hypothetical protein
MGHIVLNSGACDGVEVPISLSAADKVRMKFNPSGLERVDRLKSIAAAFISECEEMLADDDCDGREAAIAITEMQGASMFAVASATSGLG